MEEKCHKVEWKILEINDELLGSNKPQLEEVIKMVTNMYVSAIDIEQYEQAKGIKQVLAKLTGLVETE